MKKVAILCSGLDNRKDRGYENSSRNLFDNLSESDNLKVHLYKGSGEKEEKVTVVRNFGQRKWVHKKGNKIGDTFVYEYIIFACCFLFFNFFWRRKYDAIYTQEPRVAKTLYQLKFLLPGKPVICFGMGVSMDAEHYVGIADSIQIVNKEHYDNAMEKYPNEKKFNLIANPGSSSKKYVGSKTKMELRDQYGVKTDNVLISVGAVNKGIKRMDYVVDEAIQLPKNWTLVLVGKNQENEIVEKAKKYLGDRFIHLFVEPDLIPELYFMSDVAVLASYYEGFPNVVLEATQNKVMPLLHDCKRNRWILHENEDFLIDMSKEGALSSVISKASAEWFVERGKLAEEIYYGNYSWAVLKNKYLQLLKITE